jgi:hypothetical protein
MNRPAAFTFAIPVLLAGCQSGPPFIDKMQPTAMEMAVRRGQFEMACPAATRCCSRSSIRFVGPDRNARSIPLASPGAANKRAMW